MSGTLNDSTRTIIIGGGVIGLSIAWELSERGWSVVVLESGHIGRGASWAGAGILPAAAKCGTSDPYELLKSLSHELHPRWSRRLRGLTGVDTGYRRCGGIYLARSQGELATLIANQMWWLEHAVEHQHWTIDELARREPALVPDANTDILAAWFLPDDCQLRNPRHLKALAIACRLAGVQIVEAAPVERLESQDGRITNVKSARGEFRADHVCICSGAWARQLLEQLGLSSGIMPVRGQMVLYNCVEPPISAVVNEGHRYLVPREDGRLLAGSIEEEVGYVNETTSEGLSQISGWAEQVLRSLKGCPVEKSWAGLRPGSFDGLPYLGRVPDFDNLFVAAGHFRSGLHLSCATAVVMANEMEGVPNQIDMQHFRVGRG